MILMNFDLKSANIKANVPITSSALLFAIQMKIVVAANRVSPITFILNLK